MFQISNGINWQESVSVTQKKLIGYPAAKVMITWLRTHPKIADRGDWEVENNVCERFVNWVWVCGG